MKLCIIGLGKMGKALLDGILENELFAKKDIIGCDVKVENKEKNPKYQDIKTINNNRKGAEKSDLIILAVKPQIIDIVLDEIQEVVKEKLIVSIAAGITINHLKEKTSKDTKIARVMPNTPVLVGEGISALSFGENTNDSDKKLIKNIFQETGQIVEVKEELMDAVTGLSGSGPAFIYLIIEALADGGVLKGLSREKALKLSAQTVLGAARMVQETGKHPAELKDMVTSPAGTTITGLKSLETDGLRGLLIKAVDEASTRSQELGE